MEVLEIVTYILTIISLLIAIYQSVRPKKEETNSNSNNSGLNNSTSRKRKFKIIIPILIFTIGVIIILMLNFRLYGEIIYPYNDFVAKTNEKFNIEGYVENLSKNQYVWLVMKNENGLFSPKKFFSKSDLDNDKEWEFNFLEPYKGKFYLSLYILNNDGHRKLKALVNNGNHQGLTSDQITGVVKILDRKKILIDNPSDDQTPPPIVTTTLPPIVTTTPPPIVTPDRFVIDKVEFSILGIRTINEGTTLDPLQDNEKFYIIKISIKNNQDNIFNIENSFLIQLLDSENNQYDQAGYSSDLIPEGLIGNIYPNSIKKGEVCFKIPKENNLTKIIFDFYLSTGKQILISLEDD
jgi:hypothetical protein